MGALWKFGVPFLGAPGNSFEAYRKNLSHQKIAYAQWKLTNFWNGT